MIDLSTDISSGKTSVLVFNQSKMDTSKSLKIFYHPVDGVGHVNACIGLAQALAKRGHQVNFITSPVYAGTFEKFGFKEFILKTNDDEKLERKDHPLEKSELLEKLKISGLLAPLPAFEKLKYMVQEEGVHKFVFEQMKNTHQQFAEILEQEKPDFIIVDHMTVPPCVAYGSIPWAFQSSGNPLYFFNSPVLPPMFSGLPTNDRTGWAEHLAEAEKTFIPSVQYFQNSLNEAMGYSDRLKGKEFFKKSPWLNIYGYPEELDYSDVITIPENHIRVDAYIREVSEPFELPEEFKAKIKPGDKLIYVSMGSMGGIDVDLMKRIVSALADTPHKYIVSKGLFHDQFELPDNMWGEAYVPQTKIIPMVDLVITHGGNNTVTETVACGKPMLIVPLFADQFDNAQRILEKGFGDRIDPYTFTKEEIVSKIDRILNDKDMQERCRKAAERIAKSNSKEKVCEKIEQIVMQHITNNNLKN